MKRMTVAEARRLNLLSPGKIGRSKFGNKKTVYKGHQYDSKKEAERAMDLDLMLKVGVIKSWDRQPMFRIVHNGVKICDYYADFALRLPNGQMEYEDVKGVRTPVYNLKKKLVKAFYNITIKEI